jgi:hypothetical protein
VGDVWQWAVWMFHAGSRPQTRARQIERKDQETTQRTFSKMGRVNALAALCAALLTALLAGPLEGCLLAPVTASARTAGTNSFPGTGAR